jgi:hypothetical protein
MKNKRLLILRIATLFITTLLYTVNVFITKAWYESIFIGINLVIASGLTIMQIVKKDTSFILAIKFLFLTPLLRLFLMFMMVAIAPLDSFA